MQKLVMSMWTTYCYIHKYSHFLIGEISVGLALAHPNHRLFTYMQPMLSSWASVWGLNLLTAFIATLTLLTMFTWALLIRIYIHMQIVSSTDQPLKHFPMYTVHSTCTGCEQKRAQLLTHTRVQGKLDNTRKDDNFHYPTTNTCIL